MNYVWQTTQASVTMTKQTVILSKTWIISKWKITCLAVKVLAQEIWITCWPIIFPCILWIASSAEALQTIAMEEIKRLINNKKKQKEKKLRLMKDLIRCRVTWHQATWNLLPWKGVATVKIISFILWVSKY